MAEIVIANVVTTSGSIVKDIYDTSDSGGGEPEAVNSWCGEELINQVEGSYTITKCNVQLSRHLLYGDAAAGNITLEVRSGSVDGDLVCTGTYNRLSIDVGASAQQITFDLDGSFNSENDYFVILKDSSGKYISGYVEDEFYDYLRVYGSVTEYAGAYGHTDYLGWVHNSNKKWPIILYGELGSPNKPINPTPEHEGSGVALHGRTVSWEDGGGADTYNVYYGTLSGFLELVEEGVEDVSIDLIEGNFDHYGEAYYWRVDAVNDQGVTTGDEWYFTTLIFKTPYGGWWYSDEDDPGWVYADFNFTVKKRLVATAKNTFYYEDI